jgi:hypothetical protein
MKHKHAIVFCLSLLICANLAMAQDPKKIELGVFGGRTGSEGIEVEATAIGGGQVVTQPRVVPPGDLTSIIWPRRIGRLVSSGPARAANC